MLLCLSEQPAHQLCQRVYSWHVAWGKHHKAKQAAWLVLPAAGLQIAAVGRRMLHGSSGSRPTETHCTSCCRLIVLAEVSTLLFASSLTAFSMQCRCTVVHIPCVKLSFCHGSWLSWRMVQLHDKWRCAWRRHNLAAAL